MAPIWPVTVTFVVFHFHTSYNSLSKRFFVCSPCWETICRDWKQSTTPLIPSSSKSSDLYLNEIKMPLPCVVRGPWAFVASQTELVMKGKWVLGRRTVKYTGVSASGLKSWFFLGGGQRGQNSLEYHPLPFSR